MSEILIKLMDLTVAEQAEISKRIDEEEEITLTPEEAAKVQELLARRRS